jgi:hypothetical protein
MASESYKIFEGDVSGLPKCKECGVRPTRMDLHMQEHKSSLAKSMAIEKKKTTHGGWPIDEKAEREKKANHDFQNAMNAMWGKK